MSDTVELNKKRFLKRVRENISSALYDWEMTEEEGLYLSDAIVPFGEPIEKGEEELEAIIDDLVLQVEISLIKPKRKKKTP